MDNVYTGLTAAIYVDDTEVGYVNNLELTLEQNIIEVLQFGDTYKQKKGGMKNWTASVEGAVAFADSGQSALLTAYTEGDSVELKVQLNETTYFEGDALIASLTISGTPDDVLSISAEFEGTGEPTYTSTEESGGDTEPEGGEEAE